MKPTVEHVMEQTDLHVFATSDRFDALVDAMDEREEFASQMRCFVREEYGHILGEQGTVLEGPRGLERFMAKYWAGLSDEEIDEDADTEMWVVAGAASGRAADRVAGRGERKAA